MKPLDIRPVGDNELLITWEDQHRSLYTHHYLRWHCPCAGCVNEWTGKRMVTAQSVSEAIKANQQAPVGNYAIRFHWSDGHHTGIYGFEYLRKICPCDPCQIKS